MAKASKTFVGELLAYRGALQAFFYRRHAQEVAVAAPEPTPTLTSAPGFEAKVDATKRQSLK
jgi:hypothetical protein